MTTVSRRLFSARNEGVDNGTLKLEELEPNLPLPLGISAEKSRKIIKDLAVQSDDVFVVTYPKCGTTWMQQIVKLIRNNGMEDGKDIDEFSPWVELMSFDETEALPSPRAFKSHLPYHLMAGGDSSLHPSAKYINIYRNPKDVAVSLFHHAKALKYEGIAWNTFFEDFMTGKVIYGHFFKHFSGWWEHRDSNNILVLSYENMKKDLRRAVCRVSSFLGHNLSDEVITKIAKQTDFDSMKQNPAANNSWMDDFRKNGTTPFMRKGAIGDWKNYFTDEQSARMDALVAEKLGSSGIVFDYGD